MKGRDRQTVADLAVEHCGDADSMFPIMRHNDIDASAEVAGVELKDEVVAEKRTVDYIRIQEISPACTSEEEEDILTTDDESDIVTTENEETITGNYNE